MNRVLLTGGSGRLGRYVHTALLAQGFDVRNFDKVSWGDDIDQIQANILDCKRLESAMADRDVVIHLAALDAAVPATEQEFFEINVQGTWNVLEVAEKTSVQRVVLCSSIAALGIGDEILPDYLPID